MNKNANAFLHTHECAARRATASPAAFIDFLVFYGFAVARRFQLAHCVLLLVDSQMTARPFVAVGLLTAALAGPPWLITSQSGT